ncbi:hypothetical protein F5146DRAFT_1149943 [Armillaria mellea]|nr:hypothetical protein F5146DRAFT_1149943 [Armillaria mellea]
MTLRSSERIPYHVKGFQLTMDDYTSYHGGVPWRLAMEEAPGMEETPENFVTLGPSSRVTEIGGCYKTEMDVIYGVYKVERAEDVGKPAKKGDSRSRLTEHVSWFPKDASWRGSGLDVGFWSADAESWYQHQVAKYLDGEFKCANQTDWKKSLKL